MKYLCGRDSIHDPGNLCTTKATCLVVGSIQSERSEFHVWPMANWYRYTLLMRWDLPEGSFTSMIDIIIGYGRLPPCRWVTSLARLKASVLNNLAKGLSGEQGKGVGGGLEKGKAALVSPHVDNNLTITSSTTRHLCCPYRSVVHLPSFPLWQLTIMFPSSL